MPDRSQLGLARIARETVQDRGVFSASGSPDARAGSSRVRSSRSSVLFLPPLRILGGAKGQCPGECGPRTQCQCRCARH